MDITSMGITGGAVITVICYLIGQAVKVTGLDNKYIPVIVGTTGGILGVTGMFLMPDFPARDYMTAVAVGIVSGLAATGVNQAVKQLGGNLGAPAGAQRSGSGGERTNPGTSAESAKAGSKGCVRGEDDNG